eukprot:GHVR01008209.1.p1 GENE.GHVR01008209.1~~GHVR01008209.1.p1  ORF type:complete len:184 (-),score=17.14 GHVR01008209.1:516-1067(-)
MLDRTPYHVSCHSGKSLVALFLFQNGGNRTLRDINGDTCLHLLSRCSGVAAFNQPRERYNYIASLTYTLLNFDSWTYIANHRFTSPLHSSCYRGNIGMLKLLLYNQTEHSIKRNDINACDDYGLSPLHYACINGHSEVVVILLEWGADRYLTTTNSLGETCEDIAKRYRLIRVIHTLSITDKH